MNPVGPFGRNLHRNRQQHPSHVLAKLTGLYRPLPITAVMTNRFGISIHHETICSNFRFNPVVGGNSHTHIIIRNAHGSSQTRLTHQAGKQVYQLGSRIVILDPSSKTKSRGSTLSQVRLSYCKSLLLLGGQFAHHLHYSETVLHSVPVKVVVEVPVQGFHRALCFLNFRDPLAQFLFIIMIVVPWTVAPSVPSQICKVCRDVNLWREQR